MEINSTRKFCQFLSICYKKKSKFVENLYNQKLTNMTFDIIEKFILNNLHIENITQYQFLKDLKVFKKDTGDKIKSYYVWLFVYLCSELTFIHKDCVFTKLPYIWFVITTDRSKLVIFNHNLIFDNDDGPFILKYNNSQKVLFDLNCPIKPQIIYDNNKDDNLFLGINGKTCEITNPGSVHSCIIILSVGVKENIQSVWQNNHKLGKFWNCAYCEF